MKDYMDSLMRVLKENPGMIYITDSGKTIFLLVGPESKLMYASALEGNFFDMTGEEIERIITNLII